MKNFFLPAIGVVILCTAKPDCVKAQNSTSKNKSKIFAKTSSTKRRIIAQANYDYSSSSAEYVRADSTQYAWYKAARHDRYPTITPYFAYSNAQSTELHKINFSDTIVPFSKVLKAYDVDNNVISSVSFNWNKTTMSWDSSSQTNYFYTGGKLTLDETQILGSGKTWFYRGKNEYTYAGGLLDEKINYTFRSPFSSALKYYSKTKYTYAASVVNNITTMLWDSSATVSPDFYNYTRQFLTISGKDTTQKIAQTWNKVSSAWKNIERKSFDFSKGEYSEDLTEIWDNATSAWQNSAKDSLGYTGSTLESHHLFVWNTTSNTWFMNRYYEFDYTGANITTCKEYLWDGTKWQQYYEYNYQYDTYNDAIKTKTYQWDGTKLNPSNYASLINYYYEEYSTTGIHQNDKTQLKVSLYPNPAMNNRTYLDYFSDKNVASEIQITNMLGQVVMRVEEQAYIGDHSVLLQLNGLSDGIYLVNLIIEGKLQVQVKLKK